MKRKTFIISASAVAVGVPAAYYFFKNKWGKYPPVSIPEMLSSFCGEDIIEEIGKDYLKQVPAEGDKKILKEILLADNTGKIINESDDEAVAGLIGKKVLTDFDKSKLVIVKGWILSVTEARQCAVFSLTRKK